MTRLDDHAVLQRALVKHQHVPEGLCGRHSPQSDHRGRLGEVQRAAERGEWAESG